LSSSNVPIDAAFLAEAPALRIVAMQSVGYDNVDVPRLRERGIALSNSRGSLVEAVADLAYGLAIIAVRQLGPAIAWARDGRWLEHGDPPYSRDLEDATLGVVGFGAIGVALARRAQASKMRVIYHTRTPRADDAQTGGSYRTFDALLAEADCVVALLPLTPQTRGMFGDAAFARMKPSATFVNAARGPICDTNALLRALEQKKIAGAVLDVTDPEPLPPEHPLYAREDVVITPHVGSATVETRTRMAMLAAQNLLAFVEGKPLLTPVG
jgi:glyoxylate reductase